MGLLPVFKLITELNVAINSANGSLEEIPTLGCQSLIANRIGDSLAFRPCRRRSVGDMQSVGWTGRRGLIFWSSSVGLILGSLSKQEGYSLEATKCYFEIVVSWCVCFFFIIFSELTLQVIMTECLFADGKGVSIPVIYVGKVS